MVLFNQQLVGSYLVQGYQSKSELNWKILPQFNPGSNSCSIRHLYCSRKNCKPLFNAGIVLPLEFWNYTFHPIKTTHAILPGHTSPGTIKGSAKHVRSLFSFLIHLSRQKVRPADTRENISLSNSGRFYSTQGPFILREHTSTFVPLHTLGDHFIVNYFSLRNHLDPKLLDKH